MIYLIYSKDEEIINRYIDKLIIKENIDQDSIIHYALDDEYIDDIIIECNTLGLFSNKKLIILDATSTFNSSGKEIPKLINYLDNYNKDVYLIFKCVLDKVDTRKKIYKKISTIGKIECLNKDNNYLSSFIKEKLNDYKMIDIDYFLSKVGTDINNIENELNKLINSKVSDKTITKEDIDNLCIDNIEEEIFSLTDAIVNNDNKQAIKLYDLFVNKNYDVTAMIGLLSSQFRFLLQVKLLYNKNNSNDSIASILGVHPYRVKLAIGKCYGYSLESLENYLIKLYELDKKIKLGLVDKNIYFQLFILNKNI